MKDGTTINTDNDNQHNLADGQKNEASEPIVAQQDWSSVDEALKSIRALQDAHNERVWRIAKFESGGIQRLDLYVLAIIHRSLLLLHGFSDLVDARNFISATPLVRLQLDNCLRLYAATLVDNSDELVAKIMRGTPVRKQKDRDGKLMTDAYLVEKLESSLPGTKPVYKQTSGFVHLSDVHIRHLLRSMDPNTGEFKMLFSNIDVFVPVDQFENIAVSFLNVTGVLLSMISEFLDNKDEGWEEYKKAQQP